MKNEIEQLEIGESINVTGSPENVRAICKHIDGKFKIVGTGTGDSIVIRLDPDTESLRKQIIDAIESMRVFDTVRIPGDVQYIRSIVSRHNKETGRAVKVNKIHGVATLSENVMARKSLTADEYQDIKKDFEKKLEILADRVTDPDN